MTARLRRLNTAATSAEPWIAAALLAFVAVYYARYAHLMLTTGLWNDELYSILRFSGRGVRTTLTDYHVPNNHILFNLLNAVAPWRGSPESWTARLLPFIFTTALLVGLTAFLLRRRLYLESVLLLWLLVVNPELMGLLLQARGYCIAHLCVGLTLLLASRYLEHERLRDIIGIGIATFAATWAVPASVLFGAPVMVALTVVRRDRRFLIAGVATALSIALVYTPVLSQVVNSGRTIDEHFPLYSKNLASLLDAVRIYLLRPGSFMASPAVSALFVVGIILLPFLLYPLHRRITANHILVFATVFFFVGCLWLQTAPPRVMSLVVIPLAWVGVTGFGQLYRHRRISPFNAPILFFFALYVFLNTFKFQTSLTFDPIESWKETADFIEESFPAGTRVHGNFSPHFLEMYLDESFPMSAYDPTLFESGRLVRINSRTDELNMDWLGPRPSVISLAFPQRRFGGRQIVQFKPPIRSGIVETAPGDLRTLSSLTDRDLTTGLVLEPMGKPDRMILRIQLADPSSAHSLHLHFEELLLPGTIELFAGGEWTPMPPESYSIHNRHLVIHLNKMRSPPQAIELRRDPLASARSTKIVEAWVERSP